MSAERAKVWLLRWRLDYADGRTRRGLWSFAGTGDEHVCSLQPRTGLVRAAIERKEIGGSTAEIVAECAGQDFCLFKWISAARQPVTFGSSERPRLSWRKAPPVVIAAVLVTREDQALAYADGTVRVETRTAEDKAFHYAAYGR